MFVVCDTETEKIKDPEKLWLVVFTEVETEKVHVFRNLHESKAEVRRLHAFCNSVSGYIFHNGIGFDLKVLHRLAGLSIPQNQVIDTLVVSRLLNQGIEGGHSLEAIGNRLGFPKGNFSAFEAYSQEMEDYCIQDCKVTLKYYNSIKDYLYSPSWKDALRLEHDIAFLCEEMSANGFAFNIDKAKELYLEITSKLQTLDTELVTAFPPKPKFIKEITPRATALGTLHRGDFRWLQSGDLTPYGPNMAFSRIEFEPFNPSSPKQIVERLNQAGWSPFEKTKGHIQAERESDSTRLEHFQKYGWKVSEANLATLPKDAPEAARKLVQRLLLDSRRSTLEEWFNAYNPSTGRIHGKFHHIGAWTHRMSHSGPNMANIPAGDSPYAHEMRSLWTVPDDSWLVGVDADAIQLRILAHYINDPVFTQALINGKKSDGTDVHTLNRRALGNICKSRADAKTFIYAWLLGAGDAKVAQILGCSISEAKQAKKNFLEAYPGLKRLKEEVIPRDAAKGYFIGLDGRAVLCDSEHLMLAGYLQNGESIIMKKANILWKKELDTMWGGWFQVPYRQVNFVHDEWQTEVKGDYELAKSIAEIQAKAIRDVGLQLNLNCPLEGSFLTEGHDGEMLFTIGKNWAETH